MRVCFCHLQGDIICNHQKPSSERNLLGDIYIYIYIIDVRKYKQVWVWSKCFRDPFQVGVSKEVERKQTIVGTLILKQPHICIL